MSIEISTPQGESELSEFVRFHERAYVSLLARWAPPEDLQLPILTGQSPFAEGREIQPEERLNILGIGVRERARGRGVNYAMAGKSYLELAQRGWTHLSYTLVLDDNWPSRRTGEGLGCSVCANYLAYRRNFRR